MGYHMEAEMTDVLIRDVPEEVIAALDAHAARLGLSRSEYVRRRLAQDAATPGSPVGVEVTTWLIDKSALVRLAASPDAAEWAARIERGMVRITTVTRLETGYSARSS